MEANYGLEDDDIDLLKAKNSAGMEVSNGTNDKYREMIEFLENNDPTTKSYYEKACEYISKGYKLTSLYTYVGYNDFSTFYRNFKKYISNTYINLYRINDLYDYFYGKMAYSTGQINDFKLTYINEKGLVLSIPDIINPECTLDYVHHEKLFNKSKFPIDKY
mgnify:CR=1 FL=1